MKNKIQRSCIIMTSALILIALGGCDRAESVAPVAPEDSGAGIHIPFNVEIGFAKDVMDLKAREEDPVKVEAGMLELRTAYGFPAIAERKHTDGGVASVGKVAAAQATRWYRAKELDYGLDFAIQSTVNVPAGGTLTLWTRHVAGTDPYVAAYVKTLAGTASPIVVIGVSDDDDGNLDARLVWTNGTGSTRKVTFVAFAYFPAYAGQGTLNMTCTAGGKSCGSFTKSSRMAGVAVRSNLSNIAPAGCTGPTKSQIGQTVQLGGGFENTLLAVNNRTKRGAILINQDGTQALEDILTTGTGNFIVGYANFETGFPCGNQVCFESTDYYAWQGNNYTCP
jgi:hypothetical protein